jgi:hypothetical protein
MIFSYKKLKYIYFMTLKLGTFKIKTHNTVKRKVITWEKMIIPYIIKMFIIKVHI